MESAGSDPRDAALRTFLIADVRGYTRYTQEHGDEAAAALARRFAEIVGATVVEYGGSLIELRGDEALVVFSSARQALRAAVDVQRRCREPGEEGPALPLGVGVGLDAGEAVPMEGGGYRGGALNLAARLCALAQPGQILASEGVIHLARHVEGIRFLPRKAAQLKGLAQRVRVVEVVSEQPLPPVPVVARPPRRPLLRRPLPILVAAAAAAAVAGTVYALTSSESAKGLARIATDSAGLVGRDGKIRTQVAIPGRPGGIALDTGSLWVTDTTAGTLLRIDLDKRVVVDRIEVGGAPTRVAIGGGAVWVVNSRDGSVSRINTDTDTVVQTVRAGNGASAVAYGGGAAWVANTLDGTLTRIDARSGTAKSFPLQASPSHVAIGLNAVWVTAEQGGLLFRVDERTGAVAQTIPVGNGPAGVAVGGGAVWVANTPDGTVTRVDPAAGSLSKVVVPRGPTELTYGTDGLWSGNGRAGSLSLVDPSERRVERTIEVVGEPIALAASGGDVWAAVLAPPSAHRGGTLRVVSEAGDTFDSIDPGAAYRMATWQVLSMTNDGLISFKHAGGPAGGTLVPNLAVSIPSPTDGGRTYTFQLRRGIRYSSGRPVRASDFRVALERQFKAGSGLSGGIPLVGADKCSHRKCNLSRAIVADNENGTVVFHLAAPDPDLLFKLALPFGYAVPAGSPPVDVGRRPLPATGPYMIERFVPGRLLVLVRNPYFGVWSTEASPPGFPDRLVWRLGVDPEAQTTGVERGRADVMLAAPPENRLREIVTRFPAQAHAFGKPSTSFMFLNTRIRPFASLDARRALNYAADRARIVRLWGGPDLARPTCQVLPPGIAGYRPYCPYTLRPGGGTWQAPNLAKARELIAASGTKGEIVTLAAQRDDPRRLAVTRYFADLLRLLGYRPRLRLYPDIQTFYEQVGKPSTKTNMGFQGWQSDFPRSSDFFVNLLTCSAYQPAAQVNIGSSGFCVHALDRDIVRAQELQPTDPAAASALWAKVDRAIVDRAPWVPFLNEAGLDVTSVQVRNYQRNPQFGVLLDQLYVR